LEVPFAKPMIGDEERAAMNEVLQGTILTHGPRCRAFEQAFSKFVGVKHAITTSNCTTAIHLGLVACGIKPGDEVIVPAMTHVATAHAVEHCGAFPVFVDVDELTGCIDPTLIESKISVKTKAIIVVHFVGLPCDMDIINDIAQKHDIPVIEDAATALGATYQNKQAGSLAKIGCFSFYPTKHITALEGGMLTTNDDAIAEQVRSQRAFGYDRGLNERKIPGIYDIKSLGWNYRMSEGHAAVGFVQLGKLPAFLGARQKNAERIVDAIKNFEGVFLHPHIHAKSKTSWYCVNMQILTGYDRERDEVIKLLNAEGVGTSVHYPVALPLSKYYREKDFTSSQSYKKAERIAAQTISVPCGPHLSDKDVDFIIEKINVVIGR
jgi:perosamine synthetase